MTKIILPPLAEGVDKATVSFWFFKQGDSVNQGEDLVELTTDKATFNMPCPATGVLTEVILNEGDTVKVGETLGTIEEAA